MKTENNNELLISLSSNDGYVRVTGNHFDDRYCSLDQLKIYVPSKITSGWGFLPEVSMEMTMSGPSAYSTYRLLVMFSPYGEDHPFFSSLQL